MPQQTQTLVTNVTLSGVAATVIPAGSQAQTAAGDLFQSLATVTLSSGGTATVNFSSVAYGPIPCASTALNQVVSSVLGWETVTNNGSGSPASVTTLGTTTQSDQAARALRQNTLAFQGVALPIAITSALYAVQGVSSLSFLENYYSAPMGMLISVTGGTTLSGQGKRIPVSKNYLPVGQPHAKNPRREPRAGVCRRCSPWRDVA